MGNLGAYYIENQSRYEKKWSYGQPWPFFSLCFMINQKTCTNKTSGACHPCTKGTLRVTAWPHAFQDNLSEKIQKSQICTMNKTPTMQSS